MIGAIMDLARFRSDHYPRRRVSDQVRLLDGLPGYGSGGRAPSWMRAPFMRFALHHRGLRFMKGGRLHDG